MRSKAIVLTILGLFAMPMLAQAGLVTKTFGAHITNGPLAGETGFGRFSYDDTLIGDDQGWLSPEEGLTVFFSFDGQAFTEENDSSYASFPELGFSEKEPVYLDYWLVNGERGVDFNNPIIADLYFDLLSPSTAGFDYALSVDVGYVPIPGAFYLLFSGLASLIALRKRQKGPVPC